MLTLRSKLVPVVSLSARMQQYFFLFAFAIAGSLGNELMIMIAIFLYGVTALFSLVTLPVEFDASRRALAWLDSSGTAVNMEHSRAKDTLWWAAMTYVVAAIAAITQLLFLVFRLMGSRN
jgi:Zn-dependent membrane protease YugP